MPCPSIALIPFANLSGDPAEDYFGRGLVEDLAVELARFPTLEVIHPSATASWTSDRRSADATLHPDFELHGSVRRSGDSVRLAVRLIASDPHRQVWAERFDVRAGELPEVNDRIAARVAGALAIRVDDARLAFARRKPLASLELYDCWLRGRECLHTGTVDGDAEARVFFARALQIDPNYSRAYTGLSLSHFNEWSCQAWEHWDEKERLAYKYALRAAELDDTDAMVQMVLGRVLLYRRRFEDAGFHIDRALALNPNDADVLVHAALCRAYLGDAETALELARKAMRLNPTYPPWYVAPVGLALFILGRDREMIDAEAAVPITAFVDLPAFLAAAWALVGDHARARWYLERFTEAFRDRVSFGRTPEPGEPLRWLLHINPFRRDQDAARLARGLAAAGLERDPDERRPEAIAHPAGPRRDEAVFRREGAFWTLVFEGMTVQLSDAKGFHDLAALLARPEEAFHCLELAGRAAEPATVDPVLDERARREIQARIRELQREIDDAAAANDLARSDRARQELDGIVDALSGALGLRGRSRRLGSPAERARSAVTWRIRNAIRKITAAHPRFGRHLENAVKTGTYCVYRPESRMAWNL